MITPEEVNKLAVLSRLELSQAEKASFATEIDSILGYVGQITKVQASSGEKTTPTLRNVFRADDNAHESGMYTEAILNEAPRREGDYIKVKKIIQND